MKPNKQQRKVLNEIAKLLRINGKQYLNVIGEGGTGKSWLISKIKEMFEADERPVIVAATTGLASANIGGRTIHSLLKLELTMNDDAESIDELHRLRTTGDISLNENSILIIDESSMLDSSIFKLVTKLHNKLTITFGDKLQLPPVKALGYRPLGKTIQLTEQMRQQEGNLYNLISTYRAVKAERHLDVLEYVNDKDVHLIHYDEMADHFIDNPDPSKKVISYTNDEADHVVELIKPESLVYRLNSGITMWDGSTAHVMAVNGEEITIDKFPKTYQDAKGRFAERFGYFSPHRIKWSCKGYNIPVVNASIVDMEVLYVKMFLGKESVIKEEVQRLLLLWLIEKRRLEAKFGTLWRKYKDKKYLDSTRELMSVKSGVVSARHSCSLTVHKSQGQTINSVYINLDNIKRRDLMYVALSRAAKEIIFFSKDRI